MPKYTFQIKSKNRYHMDSYSKITNNKKTQTYFTDVHNKPEKIYSQQGCCVTNKMLITNPLNVKEQTV